MLIIDLEMIIMCVLLLCAVFGFGYLCGWIDTTKGFTEEEVPAVKVFMKDWRKNHVDHS